MADTKNQDQFAPKESKRRFEAALRGARIAGHKSMSDVKRDIGRKKRIKASKKKRIK